ncbi:uncharacterized protein LOC142978285 [Anticarsia gemmatalis]|uniref:uncharacterized protein LOC142978285 n=1 Tax=Anticarsia gemmatalis TaxID=129554 RepID=UPI003F774561
MNRVHKLIGIVAFLGILSYTYGADIPPNVCVRERLLDLLTKWQKGCKLPFPLPPLNIIEMPSFEGQYSGFGIKVTFVTGEMTLTGVDNFEVQELSASATDVLNATGIVEFPLLTLSADNYNLKGRAYFFYSLKGSGSMFVNFQNVKLTFGISLRSLGTGMKVDNLQLDFSVAGAQVNLADSSWPINKVLNTEGLSIIESYHSTLVDVATEMVNSTLNEYLANVTPEQFLGTFNSNKR